MSKGAFKNLVAFFVYKFPITGQFLLTQGWFLTSDFSVLVYVIVI